MEKIGKNISSLFLFAKSPLKESPKKKTLLTPNISQFSKQNLEKFLPKIT